MNRLDREKRHGKRIVDRAEIYWGWGTPAGRKRLERRAEFLIQFGKVGPGRRILELGCGKGLYTSAISGHGTRIVALDVSWDLIDAAKGGVEEADYLVGDAHRLPFENECFDCVLGVSILHHLEVNHVLRECHRVLRRGGRLVFSEPNMLNPQIFVQKKIPFIKKWLGDSPDETAFVKSRLRRRLLDFGFQVERLFPFDFLHPWVPKPLIPFVDAMGRWLEKLPGVREIAGSLFIVAVKDD